MGKQSARLYYQGNDHKDIFFKDCYHHAMYKGSQKVWEKLRSNRYICANSLIFDLETKNIFKPYKISSGYSTPLARKDGYLILSHAMESVLFSDDCWSYRKKCEWQAKSDTRIYNFENGFYINRSETDNSLYYKVQLYYIDLADNGESSAKQVFDYYHKLYPKYFGGTIVKIAISNSDYIPFFMEKDSLDGDENIYLYVVDKNTVNKIKITGPCNVNILNGEWYVINGNAYIMRREKIGSTYFDTYKINLETGESTFLKQHAIERDSEAIGMNAMYIVNGKSYLYNVHNEKRWCYVTSDFVNFENIEINRNLTIDGITIDSWQVLANKPCYVPTAAAMPIYNTGVLIDDKKISEKGYMIIQQDGEYFFVNNMFFNNSTGNFRFYK